MENNSKGKPENLYEGSEFLNDSIEQNNSSDEKEADTQDFYNQAKRGNQNNMDKAPDSYDYIDPQNQQGRQNSTNAEEEEEEESQDPRGKVNF